MMKSFSDVLTGSALALSISSAFAAGNVDGSRLAVAGNSVGGNMAAVVSTVPAVRSALLQASQELKNT
ncbi:hypothetical protein [Pseudomonas sp. 2FE]|uniref:hypothetical protein n=1 Tax=Pseudomonas sp. 2FE TaxID=2502190 RepID=UPI00355634EF